MLREMTKADWLKQLRIGSDLIPETIILRGTRHLRRQCQRYSAFFEDVLMIGSEQDFVDDAFIGRVHNKIIGFASVYGPSMASELVHIFGTLGTECVIHTGSCGGLAEHLQVGDFIVVDSALGLDGVSQHYMPSQFNFQSDIRFDLAFENSPHAPEVRSPTCGDIVTTSALLAEGYAEAAAWRDGGNCAVDLETASVFAVAQYFGMKRGSLLFVSDLPCVTGQSLLSDQVSQATLSSSDDSLIHTLLRQIMLS